MVISNFIFIYNIIKRYKHVLYFINFYILYKTVFIILKKYKKIELKK